MWVLAWLLGCVEAPCAFVGEPVDAAVVEVDWSALPDREGGGAWIATSTPEESRELACSGEADLPFVYQLGSFGESMTADLSEFEGDTLAVRLWRTDEDGEEWAFAAIVAGGAPTWSME